MVGCVFIKNHDSYTEIVTVVMIGNVIKIEVLGVSRFEKNQTLVLYFTAYSNLPKENVLHVSFLPFSHLNSPELYDFSHISTHSL